MQTSSNEELVAKNLARMLDGKEAELDSFLKTRDTRTLQSLTAVLRNMPGTDLHIATASHADLESNYSGGRRNRTLSRAQSAGSTFSKRLDPSRTSTLKSSYHQSFGGRQRTGDSGANRAVFRDTVRSSYKPQLEEWEQLASACDVDTFAETCRSLRSACVVCPPSPT